MVKEVVILKKYVADEGKVFDWAEPRFHQEPKDPENPQGEQIEIQDHLYAKKIFLAENDDIDNYIEVDEVTIDENNE